MADDPEQLLRTIGRAVREGRMTAAEAIAFVEASPTKDSPMRAATLDLLEALKETEQLLKDAERLDQGLGQC